MPDDYTLVTFEQARCITCSIHFMVPKGFISDRREDKRTFYCPNGHTMVYRENEADRLRRERDNLKQQMARVEQERDQAFMDALDAIDRAREAERKNKRASKRSAAGTCPCCNRTFQNMAEHMKHQHPKFVEGTGALVVPKRRRKAA